MVDQSFWNIVHQSGKSNTNAYLLSRNPHTDTLPLEKKRVGVGEVQVAALAQMTLKDKLKVSFTTL